MENLEVSRQHYTVFTTQFVGQITKLPSTHFKIFNKCGQLQAVIYATKLPAQPQAEGDILVKCDIQTISDTINGITRRGRQRDIRHRGFAKNRWDVAIDGRRGRQIRNDDSAWSKSADQRRRRSRAWTAYWRYVPESSRRQDMDSKGADCRRSSPRHI